MPFEPDAEIAVGTKVFIYERIFRLRKDGTTSVRQYRTLVEGVVTGCSKKTYRVEWQFREAVGSTENRQTGYSSGVRREKLFMRELPE